jgi:hypothetical protein
MLISLANAIGFLPIHYSFSLKRKIGLVNWAVFAERWPLQIIPNPELTSRLVERMRRGGSAWRQSSLPHTYFILNEMNFPLGGPKPLLPVTRINSPPLCAGETLTDRLFAFATLISFDLKGQA